MGRNCFNANSWPEHHVPVVRRDTVGQEPRSGALDCPEQYLFQRLVVGVAPEDRHPRIGAIEDVINIRTFSGALRGSHAD